MATRIADYITQKLVASSAIEEGDRQLYGYGFFLLISRSYFSFITIITGTLLGNVIESIIFYVVFVSLRTYAGGIHAKTENTCTILTTLLLLTSVLVIKQLKMIGSDSIPLLMLSVGSISILAFSPLDTREKPLAECEKKRYRTICMVILLLCIIVALVSWLFVINGIFYSVACGIFFESILLLLGKIHDKKHTAKDAA